MHSASPSGTPLPRARDVGGDGRGRGGHILAGVVSQSVEPSPAPSRASSGGRALRAAVGLSPERITELYARALEGEGPALLPVPAGTPDARARELLEAMRPDSVLTPEGETPLEGGTPVGEDTALVVTTSGSTGAPKGVELSAAALLASARASVERIGAAPGDTWLCVLPAGHISGLQVITRALAMDTEPVHAPFDTDGVAELAERLTPHVSLVPTQLRRLLAAGADVSRFGSVLLGGAAAEPELLERARDAGARVMTTYGMSETCGGCVYDGVPLDGVRAEVEPEEPDGPGRIVLSGPVLASGYRYPTGSEPGPDPFDLEPSGRRVLRTQDLGRFENGRLRVLGRVDEVINTGGHKVVPGQVNTLLSAHPGVAESVVVGRRDPEWGQRVSAVVVPADAGAPPTLEQLRTCVREHLPAYAAPRELDLRTSIPLLASGKPDLRALREA
ncbi:AMP-binding protein [Nocardiopsis sp. HNM0947]|uniref:AMP-binding protein n=1 Tax=Nocardiopsis coralli TaxID=2772213 RepID=A0ABR9PA39_9ACTN|nr:AMP-binding protein [Nocardiopsis coralli]